MRQEKHYLKSKTVQSAIATISIVVANYLSIDEASTTEIVSSLAVIFTSIMTIVSRKKTKGEDLKIKPYKGLR